MAAYYKLGQIDNTSGKYKQAHRLWSFIQLYISLDRI